jgi:DNA invertase Pin-like site-specific DNA recombinase
MAFMREGDVLIVTKLDRLARSVPDLCSIVTKLETNGITLRILAMNFDTSTPTGKLMLIIFGSIAQFEREIMLERHREGITKAKSQGKYTGRAPTARAKANEIKNMVAGGSTNQAMADHLKLGIASVYGILKKWTCLGNN